MKVGFIGTGSMGSILIESFLRTGALQNDQLIVSNRTSAKADRLSLLYPGLQTVLSNIEVTVHSDLLFLCIKPGDYKTVLDEIEPFVRQEQIIVSITSPIQLRHLESQLIAKIAKVIPSITNYVCSGASLCIFGTRMEQQDKELVEKLFAAISIPQRVAEQHTRITSDLSSCGPAFFACLLEKLIDAAVEETAINRDTAEQVAVHMLYGTALLLTEGGFTTQTLQQRVSVPGGITAEALKLLDLELDGTFNRLIRKTHLKYAEDVEKAESLFFGEKVE